MNKKWALVIAYIVAVIIFAVYMFTERSERFSGQLCVGKTCLNENDMALIKSQINTTNSGPPGSLIPPFQDGTQIRLVEQSTGKYVTFDGSRYAVNGTKDTSTVFKVYNNPAVYNNTDGGVAMQTAGGPNANNGYARHAGFTLWSHGFAANNFDFAWKFQPAGAADTFVVYNWYGGGYYLDVVGGFLQITQNSSKQWVVEAA